jgi:TusA-related sulfurtransferase
LREVDTRPFPCPGPLAEAVRLVRESAIGDTVAVIARDLRSGGSIPVWTGRTGHALTAVEELDDGVRYVITRTR